MNRVAPSPSLSKIDSVEDARFADLNGSASKVSLVTLSSIKAMKPLKPINKIIIENESAPRTHLPDGSPAPAPRRCKVRCRAYPSILSCYTSCNFMVSMAIFGCFMNLIMLDVEHSVCYDNMATITMVLVATFGLNSALGCALGILTAYLYKTRQ